MLKTNQWIAGLLISGCLAGSGSAWAQGNVQAEKPAQGETEAARNTILEELGKLQARNQEIQGKLQAIAEEAAKKHPELVDMQNRLMELYQEKLEENNYPSNDELQKLRAMQAQLQAADDMSADERQELMQEFQTKVAAMQQAQQQAQQNPEVRNALQELGEARSKAMRQIDKNSPALEKELQEIQVKLTKLQQDLQRQMQAQP